MKFKYFMITAAVFLLGFASCGSEEAVTEGGGEPKSVTVKIVRPATYAEEVTAVGVTPDIYDADVFFIGGGTVLERGSMNNAEVVSGKTFTDIPGAATEIIIVGNAGHLSSPSLPSAGPSAIDTKAKLNKVMLEHSVQADAKTDVNLLGSGAITGTGDVTVSVAVRPAISRIEIGEVGVMTAGATIPLADFKLTGIYINNTYTEVSLDYNIIPTALANILSYGATATEFIDGTYPIAFKDEWAVASVTAAPSFTPAVAGNKWGYFVMPPVENKGTTIDGDTKTSIPHIIIKVEDATLASDGSSLGLPVAYLTITKMLDINNGNAELDKLEAGKVYKIAAVAIDGKDLTPNPETGARDVEVLVSVQAWEGVDVTPAL